MIKILLVQLSFLGDTILSTPVIAGLKKIYPESNIYMLTTPLSSDLVNNDPYIEKVLTYDKKGKDKGLKNLFKKANQIKAEKFDMVYSIHRSHRTSTLLFLSGIQKRIGFKDAKMSFLYTEKRDKEFAGHSVIRNLSLLFKDLNKKELDKNLRLFAPDIEKTSDIVKNLPEKYVVMSPGSAWKTKQWHWQGFLKTAQHCIKKGFKVVLTGGREDMQVCREINNKINAIDLSGKIPVSDTMYVIKNAKLLVCNDSMALHMASAFKTPVVTVFCATSPEFGFGPWQNDKAKIVEDKTLKCKPCRPHGSNKCPNNTEACMNVSAEKVIEACEELI